MKLTDKLALIGHILKALGKGPNFRVQVSFVFVFELMDALQNVVDLGLHHKDQGVVSEACVGSNHKVEVGES